LGVDDLPPLEVSWQRPSKPVEAKPPAAETRAAAYVITAAADEKGGGESFVEIDRRRASRTPPFYHSVYDPPLWVDLEGG
jgi:hypothetical protein